jgi:CubicO group peptidase (beta-lactamase class C family)
MSGMITRRLLAVVFLIPCAASRGSCQRAPGTVDASALQQLLRAAEAAHSDAVVVWKDGQKVGAWYFGKSPKRIEAMSATKSIVNLAIGRLVTTGAIRSIDDPVSKYYPEWKQGRKQAITIRQLLDHTSGMQSESSQEVESSPDVVQFALAAELTDKPGTHFYYNNKAVNLLAGIVQKASGKKMDALLRSDVFGPLGITDFVWVRDSAGNPYSYARLEILPEDMAKLGQLVLDRGRWNGKQLIAPEWFDAIMRGSAVEPRAGLPWWLVPQHTTFVIDDERIRALAAAGVDSTFLRGAITARGRYESLDAYNAALRAAFGEKYWEPYGEARTRTRMDLKRREYGRMIGYEAQGSFGQYIDVYPDQRLVAVRMIAVTDRFSEPGDSFKNFRELARALAPH